jgi:hypothetical protein
MSSVSYQYKEKNSGRLIPPENIISVDENGLIERIGSISMRFVPIDSLDITPLSADSGYQEKESPEVPPKHSTDSFFNSTPSDNVSDAGEYYDYAFGIDEIQLKKTSATEASGFISKSIEIGTSEYIELSVRTSGGNASMEYYILDGIKEIAILSAEEEAVSHEKLFHGIDLRFPINTDYPVSIYCNGEKTTFKYNDIWKLNLAGSDVYTICYTPMGTVHQYSPDNKTIKVKVIERCMDWMTPSNIDSLVIQKYGGDKLWTM